MIKSISSINGWIKTGVVATMLAGSTILYATNSIKKESMPNQTEVVSKEGAEALKATNVLATKQNSIPTEHQPELDKNLRKYIITKEDKEYIDNIINNCYKNNGIYLGSAIIQHEIDFQQFYNFLSKNTDLLINNDINPSLGKKIKDFGPDFFQSLDYENTMLLWANNIHNSELNKQLQFDHKPNPVEASKRINTIVDNSDFLNADDIQKYYEECYKYLNAREVANSPKSAALIPARVMFIMDKLIYTKLMKKFGIFENYQFKDKYGTTMEEYFEKWMDSIKPDKNY